MLENYIGNEKYRYLGNTVLNKIDEIVQAAKNEKKITSDCAPSLNVFASQYDYINGKSTIVSRFNNRLENVSALQKEPLIGKVVISFLEDDHIEEFYITRYSPPTSVHNIVSYRAPKGRLASLEVGEIYDYGEEIVINKYEGQKIRIIQQFKFIPEYTTYWDTIRNEYCDKVDIEKQTFKSMIGLLSTLNGIVDNKMYDEWKKKLEENEDIEIIEDFGLKDRPILDRIQDEIFRKKIDTAIFLLGPAGTGKTTTLIRRLGQKLDVENLTEEEHLLLDECLDKNGKEHIRSWILFTPSDLLKSYLKEAFNKEGIPAPDKNITTWDDYKLNLGKDLSVLRDIGKNKIGFTYKANIENINNSNGVQCFIDFYTYNIKTFVQSLLDNLNQELHWVDSESIISKIKHLLDQCLISQDKFFDLIVLILKNKKQLQVLAKANRSEIDETIIYQIKKNECVEVLNLEYSTDIVKDKKLPKILVGLYQIYAKNKKNTEVESQEEPFIIDKKDDPEIVSIKLFKNLVVWIATKTEQTKISKQRELQLKLLNNCKIHFSDYYLFYVETLSRRNKIFRILLDIIRYFITTTIQRYKQYRKNNNLGQFSANINDSFIDSTELDILICCILYISRQLFRRRDIYNEVDNVPYLLFLKNHMLHQVLVDEATDFSPLQLLSMELLSHPRFQSFFACGDFNQRITTYGINSIDCINTLRKNMHFPKYDIVKIDSQYRQSQELKNFAMSILKYECIQGEEVKFPPALVENINSIKLAKWLTDRIDEIANILNTVPSIAIIVPKEEMINEIANDLQMELETYNIKVQPCLLGQTVGNEKAIRVFSISYIKGLEFESVFFVYLDYLFNLYPDLLSNFLYVGATRASRFLGVTCEQTLPIYLNYLRPLFCESWTN